MTYLSQSNPCLFKLTEPTTDRFIQYYIITVLQVPALLPASYFPLLLPLYSNRYPPLSKPPLHSQNFLLLLSFADLQKVVLSVPLHQRLVLQPDPLHLPLHSYFRI